MTHSGVYSGVQMERAWRKRKEETGQRRLELYNGFI
jgi:hypothetical protein